MCNACPALRAWMRPWSGRPSRARSPMRSRTLCRTNSSRKRSGPERIPVSSRTTALCRLPPAGEPARAQLLDLPGEPEGPGGGDARGELLGLNGEGQLLAAHDRVREVDLVGDREAGTVRLVDTRRSSRVTSTGRSARAGRPGRPGARTRPRGRGARRGARTRPGSAPPAPRSRSGSCPGRRPRPPRGRARPCRSTRPSRLRVVA